MDSGNSFFHLNRKVIKDKAILSQLILSDNLVLLAGGHGKRPQVKTVCSLGGEQAASIAEVVQPHSQVIGAGGYVRWQEQPTPVCQSFPWLPTGSGASAQQRWPVLLSPTLTVLTQKVDKDLIVFGQRSRGLPVQV